MTIFSFAKIFYHIRFKKQLKFSLRTVAAPPTSTIHAATAAAIISFCRTFAFTVLPLLILPLFLKLNGAWIAVQVAELLTLFVSLYMHRKYFWKTGKCNYFQQSA